MHVPGHSPGHIAFWQPSSRVLLLGDAALGFGVPDVDGGMSMPPTHQLIDDYLTSLERLALLEPDLALTGHWLPMNRETFSGLIRESRECVDRDLAFLRSVLRGRSYSFGELLGELNGVFRKSPQSADVHCALSGLSPPESIMQTSTIKMISPQGLLEGLNAVVTGGAQGLGLGCAQWLAQAGARVFIADKDARGAALSASHLAGDGHVGIGCDVRSAKDRIGLAERVCDEAGAIDVLVNNAGITYISPAEEMDEDEWRAVFEVNIHAMMFMCRDIGKHMLARRRGSIINIGSITSLLAMPNRAAYVTTKTAVLGLTRTLAIEWAGRGVRVNAIGPGYHRTPLLEEYIGRGLVSEDNIRRCIPMSRLGTVDDVGRVALFFASPLSEYVTGQFLMVDGGYTVFGAPEDASV